MSEALAEIQMLALKEIVDPKRGMTYSADQLIEANGSALAYFNMKSFLKSGGLNTEGTKWFSGHVPPDFVLNESDVIIANTDVTPGSDIIGSAALVPFKYVGKSTFSHHVTRLRVTNRSVSPSYLARALLLERVRRSMRAESRGTTVKMLDMAGALAIKVGVLPLEEQRVIVEILDTLDTAIHETEAIIAKLKAVKQGLLHDLLTRGIAANGELRPPQTEAPHLYKQSPLGWIPTDWDALVLGEMIEHVIDFRGRTPKKLGMDWGGGAILALSANNVQPGGIDVSREAYFGSEKLYRKWMTSGSTRKGDVLLTMEAPFGNVAQIPDDSKYILSQRVIALRFKSNTVLNDFAFWQMQSREFQQEMVRRSTGSTATGIQRAELVKIHFRVPLVTEQALIAERIFSIEQKLANELVALEKQRQEKSGLMDDLLTGCVRVTPLLQTEAQV